MVAAAGGVAAAVVVRAMVRVRLAVVDKVNDAESVMVTAVLVELAAAATTVRVVLTIVVAAMAAMAAGYIGDGRWRSVHQQGRRWRRRW